MWTCPTCAEELEDQFDSCWKCASASSSAAESGMPKVQSYRCKSPRVVKGFLTRWGHSTAISQDLTFRPEHLKFLAMTAGGGVLVDQDKVYGCQECGLVWTEASPSELMTFIEKHCKLQSDMSALDRPDDAA